MIIRTSEAERGRLAARLVDESVLEATRDDGVPIELWTIRADGDAIEASAPRLAVRDGMRLATSLLDGGEQLRVELLVEQPEYRSAQRARVVLRLVDARPAERVATAERVTVRAKGFLRAVACRRIVSTDLLPVILNDISVSGVGLTVSDPRVEAGDRFHIHSRSIHGVIDADVRVARVGKGRIDNGWRAGCFFIDPSAQQREELERIVERLTERRPAAGGLRFTELLDPEPSAEARPQPRFTRSFRPGIA